jgi:hypothetical protein
VRVVVVGGASVDVPSTAAAAGRIGEPWDVTGFRSEDPARCCASAVDEGAFCGTGSSSARRRTAGCKAGTPPAPPSLNVTTPPLDVRFAPGKRKRGPQDASNSEESLSMHLLRAGSDVTDAPAQWNSGWARAVVSGSFAAAAVSGSSARWSTSPHIMSSRALSKGERMHPRLRLPRRMHPRV